MTRADLEAAIRWADGGYVLFVCRTFLNEYMRECGMNENRPKVKAWAEKKLREMEKDGSH